MKSSKEKAIIFGIGDNYQRLKDELNEKYQIVALVDNDLKKLGAQPIDILNKVEYDKIIIAPTVYDEIYRQLYDFGVPLKKIRLLIAGKKLENYSKIWGNYLPQKDEKLCSSVCRPSDLERITQWKKWSSNPSRKIWEYAYIYQALKRGGKVKNGSKGLVFAVGKELLPSVFANEGCNILATDCPPEVANEGWEETNQYAKSKNELYHPHIISKEIFDKNVQFEYVDMRSIPHTLTGFDFLWSTCALEHLGSITASKFFIERAMDCLKPGGIAVHTTEYTLSSIFNTDRYGGSVFLRSIDFMEICETLVMQGHSPEPLDFRLDGSESDDAVKSVANCIEPAFKIECGNQIITSFGLIVRKGGR